MFNLRCWLCRRACPRRVCAGCRLHCAAPPVCVGCRLHRAAPPVCVGCRIHRAAPLVCVLACQRRVCVGVLVCRRRRRVCVGSPGGSGSSVGKVGREGRIGPIPISLFLVFKKQIYREHHHHHTSPIFTWHDGFFWRGGSPNRPGFGDVTRAPARPLARPNWTPPYFKNRSRPWNPPGRPA